MSYDADTEEVRLGPRRDRDRAGVGERLDQAEKHARGIEETVEALGERLGPILRQQGPSLADGRVRDNDSAASPLTDVVERHADHLSSLARRLHDLLDRIDL